MYDLDSLPILTDIQYGQSYVDEPIYKSIEPKKLMNAIKQLCGGTDTAPITILTGYTHVKLRWMKPDSNGELVPR